MVEYLTLFSFASWKCCKKTYVLVIIDAIEFLSLKPKGHFDAFTSVRASIALIFVD